MAGRCGRLAGSGPHALLEGRVAAPQAHLPKDAYKRRIQTLDAIKPSLVEVQDRERAVAQRLWLPLLQRLQVAGHMLCLRAMPQLHKPTSHGTPARRETQHSLLYLLCLLPLVQVAHAQFT